MPKARRMGNYLKAADLAGAGGTHIVRIETPGEHRKTTLREDLALELSVTPYDPPAWKEGDNEPKDWTLNRTSEGTLRDCFGENTDGWVNQLARVNAIRMNVMGNMKDVLFSEAHETKERAPERAPPVAAPMITPPATVTPPAKAAAITYTEPETRWLRYQELLIGKVLTPLDWQNMPPDVKTGLQAKGVLIDKDGYPFLTEDARKALE